MYLNVGTCKKKDACVKDLNIHVSKINLIEWYYNTAYYYAYLASPWVK